MHSGTEWLIFPIVSRSAKTEGKVEVEGSHVFTTTFPCYIDAWLYQELKKITYFSQIVPKIEQFRKILDFSNSGPL